MTTFGEVLDSGRYFDHTVVDGDKEFFEKLVWHPGMSVAPIGKAYFRALLDSQVKVDDAKSEFYLDFGLSPDMVQEFLDYSKGKNIAESTFKRLFAVGDEVAPCDCAKCKKRDCQSRDKVMRFPQGYVMGGINACDLL